jgi:hypothetical protein
MANTEIELELTYLASKLPNEIASATPTRLMDVYIPQSLDVHPHLRLRQKGDSYEATKKNCIARGRCLGSYGVHNSARRL